MPRMIAYLCNDDSLTPVAIQGLHDAVEFPATSKSTGFGFGWIQDGRSLLRTNPKPAGGGPDFLSLMADIPSRAIVGHFRDTDEEPADALELQPFRFRRWVFAHAGESPQIEETQNDLLQTIPEFIRGNIKGGAGAEILGHMFLTELHRRDLLERGRTKPQACAEAMLETMNRLQVEAAIADYAAVSVTERGLVAGRLGRPLFYRQIRGLEQFREQPLFAGHKPKPVRHPSFKAVVVTDAPAMENGWTEVADGRALYVDADWNVQLV